jgi:hypothetical protein
MVAMVSTSRPLAMIQGQPWERETSVHRGRRLRDVPTRGRLDDVAELQHELYAALTIGDAEGASRARIALARLHAEPALLRR